MSPKLYRPNVAGIILNDQGKIFLGQRIDAPDSWQIPQGGIKQKKNENPVQALWRELGEELGLKKPQKHLRLIAEHPDWLSYDFPQWLRDKGGKFARFRGQTQKYFLLRFIGQEDKITLEQNGHREFISYRWAEQDDVAVNVASFKADVTRKALDFFQRHLPDVFVCTKQNGS